jgi:hypothetical protein
MHRVISLFFTVVFLLHGCTEKKSDEDKGRDATLDGQAGMRNPASAYCELIVLLKPWYSRSSVFIKSRHRISTAT